MQYLPNWVAIIIRIILLPIAAILHLIPHVMGFTASLILWVRYGGEFTIYQKDERVTISKIYDELKNKTHHDRGK